MYSDCVTWFCNLKFHNCTDIHAICISNMYMMCWLHVVKYATAHCINLCNLFKLLVANAAALNTKSANSTFVACVGLLLRCTITVKDRYNLHASRAWCSTLLQYNVTAHCYSTLLQTVSAHCYSSMYERGHLWNESGMPCPGGNALSTSPAVT